MGGVFIKIVSVSSVVFPWCCVTVVISDSGIECVVCWCYDGVSFSNAILALLSVFS